MTAKKTIPSIRVAVIALRPRRRNGSPTPNSVTDMPKDYAPDQRTPTLAPKPIALTELADQSDHYSPDRRYDRDEPDRPDGRATSDGWHGPSPPGKSHRLAHSGLSVVIKPACARPRTSIVARYRLLRGRRNAVRSLLRRCHGLHPPLHDLAFARPQGQYGATLSRNTSATADKGSAAGGSAIGHRGSGGTSGLQCPAIVGRR